MDLVDNHGTILCAAQAIVNTALLPDEMIDALNGSTEPFGRVTRALAFRRRYASIALSDDPAFPVVAAASIQAGPSVVAVVRERFSRDTLRMYRVSRRGRQAEDVG